MAIAKIDPNISNKAFTIGIYSTVLFCKIELASTNKI